MLGLLFTIVFVLLQGVVIFLAVGCFVRKRHVAYYFSLYGPPIGLGLFAALGGGDDWVAVMLIQTGLSITYNLYISKAPE